MWVKINNPGVLLYYIVLSWVGQGWWKLMFILHVYFGLGSQAAVMKPC